VEILVAQIRRLGIYKYSPIEDSNSLAPHASDALMYCNKPGFLAAVRFLKSERSDIEKTKH
jgi:hypothetical protein